MRVSEGVRAATRALYGVALAFPVALFSSAVVTDIAYLRTAEIQWSNFSAWLIAGGVLFSAVSLVLGLFGILAALRSSRRTAWLLHLLLLAAMFVLGLVNSFKHSQDGWSSVGVFGMALTGLCGILALIAGGIAYSGLLDDENLR